MHYFLCFSNELHKMPLQLWKTIHKHGPGLILSLSILVTNKLSTMPFRFSKKLSRLDGKHCQEINAKVSNHIFSSSGKHQTKFNFHEMQVCLFSFLTLLSYLLTYTTLLLDFNLNVGRCFPFTPRTGQPFSPQNLHLFKFCLIIHFYVSWPNLCNPKCFYFWKLYNFIRSLSMSYCNCPGGPEKQTSR